MSEAKGHELYKDAESKLKGSFMGLNKKPDLAAELFGQACNNFKVAKNWEWAAKCSLRLADISMKAGEEYDAASALLEAAKMQARFNINEAIRSMSTAKDLYVQKGRVSQAARACKEMAVALKAENPELAIKAFQEAASLFDSENSPSEQGKMLLEAAQLLVQIEHYAQAGPIFEEMGQRYSENNLLRYSAKDQFLNAGLCWLAQGDVAAVARKLEDYCVADVSFADSRQFKLLSGCHAAFEAGKPDDFATATAEFDSMTKLEPFRTQMLLAAKKLIQSGGADDLFMGDQDFDLT